MRLQLRVLVGTFDKLHGGGGVHEHVFICVYLQLTINHYILGPPKWCNKKNFALSLEYQEFKSW